MAWRGEGGCAEVGKVGAGDRQWDDFKEERSTELVTGYTADGRC